MTTRSGYSIKIVAFIPVDPSDLTDHGNIIADIDDAKSLALRTYSGEEVLSADAMFKRLEVETFDVKPVTRRAKGEGEAAS